MSPPPVIGSASVVALKKIATKRMCLGAETIRELSKDDRVLVRGAAILLSHVQQGCNTSPLMCGSLVGFSLGC